MVTMTLEAQTRLNLGKGASRRLRRLDNQVPAIIYGGDKEPHNVQLPHNKVVKALENEAFYSSIFDVVVDGKKEHVILKDLQRHPYKPIIMHMDLQRVSPKDVLVKMVPIHFLNQDIAKGIKQGGMVNHNMSQVEVRCQAKNLPEFIEVDLTSLALDEIIHLSQLKLPKGVQLTADISDSAHDHPVVSIHKPRASAADAAADASEEAAE